MGTIDSLRKKMNEQLPLFYCSITVLMAWILFCRENRLKLNLSDVDISKLYDIDTDFNITRLRKIEGKSFFGYISSNTNVENFDFKRVLTITKELSNISNPKVFVRGKFELWFLFAFCKKTTDVIIPRLNKSIKAVNRVSSVKYPKCKIHVSITYQNILQLLAPRIKSPESVQKFLSLNFGKIPLS